VFIAMRLLPGDPLLMLLSSTETEEFTTDQLEALRHQYGLDKPLIVQYFDWLGNVLQGDLGRSIASNCLCIRNTAAYPITFHLGILSFIFSVVIGIPAGHYLRR
jgi:peptide/nickel transport system permease protein